MISFKTYLTESFKNIISGKDDIEREKYADEVYRMVQASYANIGGIRGSGFGSAQDMIKAIPFWKLYFHGGRLRTVVLYKDKGGRKLVALATDGSPKGKSELERIMKETLKVAYGEYSKNLLAYIMRKIPPHVLEPYIIPPSKVARLLPDDIIIPSDDYVKKNLDKDDVEIYTKFPEWKSFFYVRKIGNRPTLKIAIGSPNKTTK
jgi:hypothetical protein